jgi:hypothetical protein
LVISAISTVGLAAQAFADQQTAIWNGGSGSWLTPSQWSGGVVPNNSPATTFKVEIDGGKASASTVGLTQSVTIDELTIDTGDTLNDSSALNVQNALTVNGMLKVVGRVTLPTDATLEGVGTVQLGDGLNFGPLSQQAGSLTISPGMTVRGGDYVQYFPTGAYLGSTSGPLINRGHIIADMHPGYALTIAGSTITNTGSIEARNGAIIGIDGHFSLASLGSIDCHDGALMVVGQLDNAGQVLSADASHGGLWLTGTIHGGTVSTGDGRALAIPDYSTGAMLDNVVLNGSLIAGGKLTVPAGQAFTGNADILLPDPQFLEDLCSVAAASGPTTIGNGITIHGGTTSTSPPAGGDWGAVVGNSGQSLVNQGAIHADVSGERIFLHGTNIINSGTFEADDGAELVATGAVTFAAGSHFVVGGTGSMSITGNLDLSAAGDVLEVLPLDDGSAYNGQTIIAFSGTRSGRFDFVTPGITVSYGSPVTQTIRIFGTPIPEPMTSVLLLSSVCLLRVRRNGFLIPVG